MLIDRLDKLQRQGAELKAEETALEVRAGMSIKGADMCIELAKQVSYAGKRS